MKKNIINIMLTISLILTMIITPVFAEPDSETDVITSESAIESDNPQEDESEVTEPDKSSLFNDYVLVGLKYGSSAEHSFDIYSENGFIIADIIDGVVTPVVTGIDFDTITLFSENGVVSVAGNDISILYDLGYRIVLPADYDTGGVFEFNDNPYRGGIAATLNSDGTINLINAINIVHYVYGVLDSEMYHDNPIEALKAQAVTARSFAKVNEGRHSSYGFDLCTGTHCQVYKGYSDEHDETNKAVDETAGLCIYYEDEPVSAYYFKNSGGHTQNIRDVWGSSRGYLVGVKDEFCPDYPWTVTYSFSEISSKLKSAGTDIGTLEKIEIASRNEAGAVDTLKFTGTSGTATLSKERIRTFFGSSIIKSTMFSFKDSLTDDNGADDSDNEPITSVSGNLSVLGAGGQVSDINLKDVYVIGAGNNVIKQDLMKLLVTDGSNIVYASAFINENDDIDDKEPVVNVSEYVTSGEVTFVGKGYGHGIGMPQDSAIEMAKQGFAFDEILQYYYTGVEIK